MTVEGLSPEQLTSWALLGNNQFADWDQPALAELLAGLVGQGIDTALSGFETREIDSILASLPRLQDPDALPAPAGAPEPAGQLGLF